MEVLFLVHEEVFNKTYEKRITTGDHNVTLSEAFKEAGVNNADVSGYYPLSEFFYFNTEKLPYLISGEKINYNVSYDDAKMVDFLRTHAIGENKIKVVSGMIQAGGPEFLIDIESWELVINVISGVIGFSLKDLILTLYNRFKKNKIKPQIAFDLILSNEVISSAKLASQLDVEKETAKQLLKGLGYKYDNRRQSYVKGKESEQIERALKNNEKEFIKGI